MIGIGNYQWFYSEIERRVLADKTTKALDLAQGAAADFADYRYGCGVLAGLDLALEIAGEIKKELDQG